MTQIYLGPTTGQLILGKYQMSKVTIDRCKIYSYTSNWSEKIPSKSKGRTNLIKLYHPKQVTGFGPCMQHFLKGFTKSSPQRSYFTWSSLGCLMFSIIWLWQLGIYHNWCYLCAISFLLYFKIHYNVNYSQTSWLQADLLLTSWLIT